MIKFDDIFTFDNILNFLLGSLYYSESIITLENSLNCPSVPVHIALDILYIA